MAENRRVVVTGLGVVSPVGSNMETAWNNLVSGYNGIGPITYFDTTNYKAKLGAQVQGFDPMQYMDRSETLRSDKFAQYAMGAAVQAVEGSGVIGTLPPERVAVYFGSGIGGLNTVSTEISKLESRGPHRVSPLCVPMMIANMAAGMIAIRYNCQGAALPAVTACASGSNAIGEALRVIRHGYADAVITGGAEASIVPVGIAGFINMKALSVAEDPNAASLPFDARRGGFVIGEGAAALVLEEYEHAKARGAKIYAELCGYGVTCDAYHITAPAPGGEGGARAMQQALDDAGVAAGDVDYINAHGTSTPLNDSGETAAIKTVFGQHAYELAVSSTKSMTGHMLGAAGGVEAIFTAMALKDGYIPATINYKVPDPACDLDYVPNEGRKAELRYALSNSLGFGGHNACVLFKKWEG